MEAPTLDWVIVGGETGPGARPMHPDWVRSLRDQCEAAAVPFFFKSWGEWEEAEYGRDGDVWLSGCGIHHQPWEPNTVGAPTGKWCQFRDVLMRRVGKKSAGRVLDGRTWEQFPEVGR